MPEPTSRVLLWSLLGLIAAFLALSALYARSIEWNVMRLAVSAAMAAGDPIYPAADQGVITGHIYPPVAAAVFLPALIMPTIGSEIVGGTAISMLFVLGPFAALAWFAGHRAGAEPMSAWLAFAAAAFVCLLDPGLRYVTVMVHADGPAIGFGGIALLCAATADSRSDRRWLVSGACVAAACACKQTLIPVALLTAGTAVWRHGPSALLRFGGGALAVSAPVFGWLALTNQLGSFFYNTLELPRRHPWVTSGYTYHWSQPAAAQSAAERMRAATDVFIPLMQRTWPLLALGTLAAIRLPRANTLLERFAGLSGLAAWLQFPLVLASAAKVGGDVNNQAPTPWFALAASLALGLTWLAAAAATSPASRSTVTRSALTAVTLVLAAANFPRITFLAGAALRPPAATDGMTAYLRQHPGTVYLPWNPLLTYRIEDRRDHFEYGVFDRDLAGRPISAAHYRAHLPPKLTYVAVRTDQPPSAHEMYRRYLALRPVPSPVPGWNFFAVDTATRHAPLAP